MTRFFLIFCLIGFFVFPFTAAQADLSEPLTINLAEDHVDITTGFDGAHLVLFGTKEAQGELTIVLRGPKKDAIVRQKNNLFGVWMNTESITFPDVPSYYDYAVEEELDDRNGALLQEMKVGLDPSFFAYEGKESAEDVDHFRQALLRNKQEQKFYPLEAKAIQLLNENLFKVEFYLPASVPKGDYVVHAYLMRSGKLLNEKQVSLHVKQVGLSSKVNKFAYGHSFAYGILCVMLALLSGWGINMLRRGF